MSAPLDVTDAEAPQAKSYAGRGLLLLAVLGGVGWLAYRMYPAHHRVPQGSNVIDNVFANNLVLFAGRLVLVATAMVLAVAATLVVVSFWKQGKAGHWLTRFGPLETQAIEEVRGEVEMWRRWWTAQNQQMQALQGRLVDADALIGQLSETLHEMTVGRDGEGAA